MGPRSDNRGYVRYSAEYSLNGGLLQWVHGRITVVMAPARHPLTLKRTASMGPRSDNRGYGQRYSGEFHVGKSFNGSTVG